eukprot:GEMP01020882.1.p1 GENE.GEMP01020882.1~~GEMP01020882.1.p1  ORF type:complete len:507 (+),score=113.16 GEMP01020882.1:65-1585(+)
MYGGDPPIRAQNPEDVRRLAYQSKNMQTSIPAPASSRDINTMPNAVNRDGDKAIQNASPYERMIQYSPAAPREQQPSHRAAHSFHAPPATSMRSSSAAQYGAENAPIYDSSYSRPSHLDHSRMSQASQVSQMPRATSQTQSCMDIRALAPMPPRVDDHYRRSSGVTTHQGCVPRGGPDLGRPSMPLAAEYHPTPTMAPAPPFVTQPVTVQAACPYFAPQASTSTYSRYSRSPVPLPRDVSPMVRQSPSLTQYRNVSNMSLEHDGPASPLPCTPSAQQYGMPLHRHSPSDHMHDPIVPFQQPGFQQPAPMSTLHESRMPFHQPIFPQPTSMSPLHGSRRDVEEPAFQQPAAVTPIHSLRPSAARFPSQMSLQGDRAVAPARSAQSSMSLQYDREPRTPQPASPMHSKPCASKYAKPLTPNYRESGYSVNTVASPMRGRGRESIFTQKGGMGGYDTRDSMYEVGMGRPAPETRSISPCPRYRHLRVGDQREPHPSMRTTKVIRGADGC